MKRMSFFVSAGLVAAFSAQSTELPRPDQTTQTTMVSVSQSARAESSAAALAAARASSAAGANAAGGSATGGSATANGNVVNIAGGFGAAAGAAKTYRNTPDLVVPSMLTNSPCTRGVSGGAGGGGVSIAFGGFSQDVPCDLRYLSLLFNSLGERDKALAVADGIMALACQDDATAKAMPALCQRRDEGNQPVGKGGQL
jgi:hypothetical protein